MVFPKYVVRVLTNDQRHLLQIDGKYRNYSFYDMIIGSSDCLVVEIDLKRFTKLFPSETYWVFTKKCEPITQIECTGVKSSEKGKPVTQKEQPPKSNGSIHTPKEKPSYYEGITKYLHYSLTYGPGNRFYNSERYSRLCA